MSENAIEKDKVATEAHLEEGGNQYLTFNLADEDYGIDILRVQEIRGWEESTRLPNAPEYVRGVVNIRGTIVPVYDLRLKFNLEFKPYTQNTVVIVIKVYSRGQAKSIGIIVDAVSDVLHGAHIDVTRSPDFGNENITKAISGLATFENKMVVLLDVDRLLMEPEDSASNDSDNDDEEVADE